MSYENINHCEDYFNAQKKMFVDKDLPQINEYGYGFLNCRLISEKEG